MRAIYTESDTESFCNRHRWRSKQNAPLLFWAIFVTKGPEARIVRICTLASGSSGNSTFVATERTRLLVDAGLSFRDTCKRLISIGEDPLKLDAVLITHEHTDHVGGLPRLARKLDIPIYMTRLTAPAME